MNDNKSSQPKSYPEASARGAATAAARKQGGIRPAVRQPRSLWETRDCARLFGSASGHGLTLDILCYQQMKIGMLRSHQRPALESLLGKSHVHAKVKGDAVHRSDDEDARRWFADPSSRPATMKAIEDAGYPLDAVEVEAF